MKKIIIACVSVVSVAVLMLSLVACNGDKEKMQTTTMNNTTEKTVTTEDDSSFLNAEDGKITDVSEKGDNGLAGEIVSDITKGITDVSEKISEKMNP